MNDDTFFPDTTTPATTTPVVATPGTGRGGRRKAYLAAALAVAGSLAAATAVGFAGDANAETLSQDKTQIGSLYPNESDCEQALRGFEAAGKVPYDGGDWSFSEGECWEWGEEGVEFSLRVVLGARAEPISP